MHGAIDNGSGTPMQEEKEGWRKNVQRIIESTAIYEMHGTNDDDMTMMDKNDRHLFSKHRKRIAAEVGRW